MANRFTESFTQNGSPQSDIFSQISALRNNPNQFLANQINALANQGINVPKEYQNNPEAVGRYLLQNAPAAQQNKILQTVSSLQSIFGFSR